MGRRIACSIVGLMTCFMAGSLAGYIMRIANVGGDGWKFGGSLCGK